MQATSVHPPASAYHLRAWPLVYGTLLTTVVAVVFGVRGRRCSPRSSSSSWRPARLRRVAIPVIRLLASVPSVVYGLIGVLVLVPFVGNHLITASEKASVQNVVELTGAGLLVTVVILTVMITPIMIALICEALASVPSSWREGAIALGLNPLRAILAVTLRADPPGDRRRRRCSRRARALGEAIMISMVSGSARLRAQAGRRAAGLPLSSRCARSPPRSSTTTKASARRRSAPSLYAFALLLLFSALRAVGRRLSDQAAAAQVPGARMSTLAPVRAPASRARCRPAAGRRSSPMSWRWSDRFALVLRMDRGARAVPDRRRDRPLHGLPRHPVPAPGPALLAARRSATTQAGTGGFLDPLLGPLLLTADRDRAGAPAGGRAARCGSREYGRPRWLARVVESSIEIVAGTPDIVIALFGLADLPAQLLRAVLLHGLRRRRSTAARSSRPAR